MGFDLFEKEARVIASAKQALSANTFEAPTAKSAFSDLLKQYEKLYRTLKRLVRMSDRNESDLNELAKSLEEKTQELEGLSVKLSKYLSPQVYQSIFSGQQTVEIDTKRKKLTIFFSDIKDFTEMAEDLQPEELTLILNRYFEEMCTIALRHGATIDKFMGDAMMLFFGDPESKGTKQDALSCVEMAFEMQEKMIELNRIWPEYGLNHSLQMRIGINTGFCNVGNFGSPDRLDYTIIGGAVNLAARLEKACDPGGILISAETKSLLGDRFSCDPRGQVSCKGIRRPVEAFAIEGIGGVVEAIDGSDGINAQGLSLKLDTSDMSADQLLQAEATVSRALNELRQRIETGTRDADA